MAKDHLITCLFFICCACNGSNQGIVQDFPKDQTLERKQYAGNMFGNKDGIVIFEDKNKNGKDSISNSERHEQTGLWERAIDFVSGILPISIVDKNVGLVSTDWGNIESISGTDDLYRMNLIISGQEIERKNISISVFKKEEDGNTIKDDRLGELILNKILNQS